MKTATFAAAAAGLLGSVVAQDTDDWSAWSSTSEPVAAASTASVAPVSPASSTDNEWVSWTTTTTPMPVSPASTSTTTTWYSWTTTTTTPMPVSPTSSSSASTWSTWVSTSSGTTPQPVEGTSSSPATWSAWESASSGQPVEATSTYTGPFVTSTQTYTSTVYSTITVYPNDTTTTVTATATWSNWVSATLPGQCAMAVVTSYGSPTWKPTPATPAASSASASSAPASSWSTWSSATTPASSPVSPASSSSSSSTWAAWSSPSPSSSSGSHGISANGNKFGMTYSPYTSAGACKDAATVDADIAKLAGLGFAVVRVYSTDCDTLPNVGGAAQKYGLKLILGVFISDTGISGAQPQVTEIIQWGQWDLVELIVVGNECVFQGYCSAGDLGAFIGSCKSAFSAAGYTGPCTTTDDLGVWQQYGSQWCDVVDVVAANLYAFFNPDVDAAGAGAFIQSEINALNQICPGKKSYVMESGWPSAATSCNGKACASPENQAVAIEGIFNTSGSEVVFFSFEDEEWKSPGQWGAEQHFGCASVFAN